jgi:hypothetical protein
MCMPRSLPRPSSGTSGMAIYTSPPLENIMIKTNLNQTYKLQFYLEQMYSCNQFHQTQRTARENKTKAIKTGWTEMKQYFKGLVRNFKIYKQNSGGTTGKSNFESANQATKAAKATNFGSTSP